MTSINHDAPAHPPAAHNPRVSIGLAVYNGERYVAEAIESALNQTYADLELVISDNASTDRTAEICQSYARRDPRIRYSRNAINIGLTPNLGRVADLSRGEYFKWLYHDDPMEPQFLERCVAALDGDAGAVLAYPKAWIVNDAGDIVAPYDPTPDMTDPQPHRRFAAFLLNAPDLGIQSSGLVRLAAVRKCGPYPNSPGCDEVLLAVLALQGTFHEVPERLTRVRVHQAQASQQSPRDRMRIMNTKFAKRVTFHRWMYLEEAIIGVKMSPAPASEKIRCLLVLARWAARWKNLRTLAGDFVFAVPQVYEYHLKPLLRRPGTLTTN